MKNEQTPAMTAHSIHYVNQLDYRDLPYPTTLNPGETLKEPYPSCAVAACGLCCLVMVREGLTGVRMPLQEAVRLSVESGANVNGTDMQVLGSVAAERYGLEMRTSDTFSDAETCLREGGLVIANAGKAQGLFSDGGHFIVIAGIRDGRAYVLDPSRSSAKYDKPYRRGLAVFDGPYVVTEADRIPVECANRHPAYYLFRKTRES